MDKYDIKARRKWLMVIFILSQSFACFLALYLAILPTFKFMSNDVCLLLSILIALVVFVRGYYNIIAKWHGGLLATLSYDGIQFYNQDSYFLPWEDVQEVSFRSYVRVMIRPEKSILPGVPVIHFLPKVELKSKYGTRSYKARRRVYIIPSTALGLRFVKESRAELSELVMKYSKNRFQVVQKPKSYS